MHREIEMNNIRNFCIIAHIDHGKSTLADRLLEITGTIEERLMKDQVLDTMDLERERGITIKAQAVKMLYRSEIDGNEYLLNLIDTPGHVDFSYEVSRALASCEGAVLLVDASQGVEAQTVSNAYLAMEAGLTILPVINKVDLPQAEIERVREELMQLVGCSSEEIVGVSGKTGEGVRELIENIIDRFRPPEEDGEGTRAMIFDSVFDQYRGVIAYVRLFGGLLKKGDPVSMMGTGARYTIEEIGVLSPEMHPADCLAAGQVGYIVTGLKDVRSIRVGDTITPAQDAASKPLPGYMEPKPMVFAGIFPVDPGDYELLRDAVDKLKLNDASFSFEPESSDALGFGFRCGFLGLLHMDIVRERLEREFHLDLVCTAPNVAYEVMERNNKASIINSPSSLPDRSSYLEIREPMVEATILVPAEHLGAVLELCRQRRGESKGMTYISSSRAELRYRLPLAEIVVDFYDQLKSRTRGYASFDYDPAGFEAADLAKVEILINGEPVDAFSSIVPRERAFYYGKAMVNRLRRLIPRQMFEVPLQAAVGGKIIARETIAPMRKDVIAKCYGGDITRKKKLLAKQKEGKKRLKMVGKVEIPQEAFISMISIEEK